MKRPSNLPDFAAPPLNEVVIGIQFAPLRDYQDIMAQEIWQVFRDRFPHVQEKRPLAPAFETFGLPSGPQVNFEFGPVPRLLWFLSTKQDELIPFQNDKLFHNWRKIGDQSNVTLLNGMLRCQMLR